MPGIKQAAGLRAKKPKTPTGVKGSRNAAQRRGAKRVGRNTTKSGYKKI